MSYPDNFAGIRYYNNMALLTGDNRTCCYFFAIGASYVPNMNNKIPGPTIIGWIRAKVQLLVRKDC